MDQEVRNNQKKLNSFLDSILKTEMVLDENILSKNEYEKALSGKKHFRDANSVFVKMIKKRTICMDLNQSILDASSPE